METIEGHLQGCFRGFWHVEAIELRFGGGFVLRGCREVYTGMSRGTCLAIWQVDPQGKR